MNPFAHILAQSLPRLYACCDIDPASQTSGWADRSHWAWKTIDFPNATMQGGVHALAVAIELELVDNPVWALGLADSLVAGLAAMTPADGSLCEAYPNERSFCVTALAAFDVLSALDTLGARLEPEKRRRWMETVRPLLGFLVTHDEDHAFISNHLATAVAACFLWARFSGETTGRVAERGRELLRSILARQSAEGWYLEYEGPDPGYQTLATYYLFCAWRSMPRAERPALLESLRRSATFLVHFAHPDGTVGGLYGSRNTEVFYPGGVVGLAREIPEFGAFARSMLAGLESGRHLLPLHIDAGNFVPLLNAYAVAALETSRQGALSHSSVLPCQLDNLDRDFPEAGIRAFSSPRYYALVNYKKGGTLKVFDKRTGRLDLEDGGVFGRLADGRKFSTQVFDPSLSFADDTIRPGFWLTDESRPGPAAFAVLRILGLTVFRSTRLGQVFKRFVVKKLMTGKERIPGGAERRFVFEKERIVVRERITPPPRVIKMDHPGKAKAIHMASSGYPLKQDREKPETSSLVRFEALG